jgi:hypothetical protein
MSLENREDEKTEKKKSVDLVSTPLESVAV